MGKILSVSVASYNVEKFIEQNMNSFLNTNVSKKIEVLIVDDGSSDNTASIAKEYENKYPDTIRLIKKENGGPGSTVNKGIQEATGKYFRMVDGDDWVNTTDLEKYIDFLENNEVDVVYTDYCMVDDKTGKESLQHIDFDQKNQVLAYDSVCDRIPIEMHNVTYLTKILKDNHIVLDNCFYTDTEYVLFPVKYLKSIAVLDCLIYMYRVSLDTQSVNINSLIKNNHMHMLVLNHILEDFKHSIDEHLLSETVIDFMKKRIVKMCGTQLLIFLCSEKSKENKEKLVNFINGLKKYDLIYSEFSNLTTVKLLNYSGYAAYGILNKIKRKQMGAV